MIDVQEPSNQIEVRNLLSKSREAALSAVQMFNNPLTVFKTEAFIVLMVIAWRSLLHAYYEREGIEYWSHQKSGKLDRRYWALDKCLRKQQCPLNSPTKRNLEFLIGLRNEIEHHYSEHINLYSSARYVACSRNYERVITEIFGNEFSVGSNLSLAIQFQDFVPSDSLEDPINFLPNNVAEYITKFDSNLSEEDYQHSHFSYRLFFVKKQAGKRGQADRIIEFFDADSENFNELEHQNWFKKEVEKPKYLPKMIKQLMNNEGYPEFNIYNHTQLWKFLDAKNPGRGYGITVAGQWYWYERWIHVVRNHCRDNKEKYA